METLLLQFSDLKLDETMLKEKLEKIIKEFNVITKGHNVTIENILRISNETFVICTGNIETQKCYSIDVLLKE